MKNHDTNILWSTFVASRYVNISVLNGKYYKEIFVFFCHQGVEEINIDMMNGIILILAHITYPLAHVIPSTATLLLFITYCL